jgi:hypothetical protein
MNSNGTNLEDTQWKRHDTKEFSITYPEDWELDLSGQMGSSFLLFSNLTDAEDNFRENVNLMIQDLSGQPMNLNQFIELSENQVRTLITDGQLELSKRHTKDEREFHEFVYTGTQGLYKLKFMQYCWVESNQAKVLSFTAEQDQFDLFAETAGGIMKSFEIKN